MIRARGEHDGPFVQRWRPARPPHAYPLVDETGDFADQPPDPTAPRRRALWWRRAAWISVCMALGLTGGVAIRAGVHAAAGPTSTYPSTPRGWVNAFLASAIDDAPRVCRTLLSPSLADSYRHTRAGSCLRYFAVASDSAVKIERVVQVNGTAVVSLRQRTAPHSWSTVVLDRHHGGWRAVEFLNASPR